MLAYSTRYLWILMNSEEWMFGCQVMNQSVENGNIPLGGDMPFNSLYNFSKRSLDRDVSDSSNCRRAPSRINSIANWISCASVITLFLPMLPPTTKPVVTLNDKPARTAYSGSHVHFGK